MTKVTKNTMISKRFLFFESMGTMIFEIRIHRQTKDCQREQMQVHATLPSISDEQIFCNTLHFFLRTMAQMILIINLKQRYHRIVVGTEIYVSMSW